MSDKLFAACCLGTPVQHAEWENCPLERANMDDEATYFAAHLLMPENLLSAWLDKNPLNIDDDNYVDRAAKAFRVPKALVVARLMEARHVD